MTFDQLIKQQLPLSTPCFPLSIDLGRDLKLAACRLWWTDSSQLRLEGALRGWLRSRLSHRVKAGISWARIKSIHKQKVANFVDNIQESWNLVCVFLRIPMFGVQGISLASLRVLTSHHILFSDTTGFASSVDFGVGFAFCASCVQNFWPKSTYFFGAWICVGVQMLSLGLIPYTRSHMESDIYLYIYI